MDLLRSDRSERFRRWCSVTGYRPHVGLTPRRSPWRVSRRQPDVPDTQPPRVPRKCSEHAHAKPWAWHPIPDADRALARARGVIASSLLDALQHEQHLFAAVLAGELGRPVALLGPAHRQGVAVNL